MNISPVATPKTSKFVETIGKVVPQRAKNWISNPRTAEFVENTFFAVSVETCLKMVGRPTFIMMDKEADSVEKKKFAAVKEMLYQAICLGLYLGALPTIKKGLYSVISKSMSKKDSEAAEKIKAFNAENKAVSDAKEAYKQTGTWFKRVFNKDEAMKAAKLKWNEAERAFHQNIYENPKLQLGKGAKEMGAIIGSILMLTVVAPQISHFIIHPIMNALGFENKEGQKH